MNAFLATIARDLRLAGARTSNVSGLVYDPLGDRWFRSDDVAVNYILHAALDVCATGPDARI